MSVPAFDNEASRIPVFVDEEAAVSDPARVVGAEVPAPREFPAVVGLDLSLTGTGYAVRFLPEEITKVGRITTSPDNFRTGPVVKGKRTATYGDRLGRLQTIGRAVLDHVPDGSLVFLEAPAYAANGSGTFDRSGLWWLLFNALDAMGCRVVPVPPSTRALWATGKGNGGKDAVMANVTRRFPDLEVSDNNVADAVFLMSLGAHVIGAPVEPAPAAANLKALAKLEAV